jgi:hypothetical protein
MHELQEEDLFGSAEQQFSACCGAAEGTLLPLQGLREIRHRTCTSS